MSNGNSFGTGQDQEKSMPWWLSARRWIIRPGTMAGSAALGLLLFAGIVLASHYHCAGFFA